MNILLLAPYFTGSHRAWAEGYAQHSRHRVRLMTLAGRHWKWRMHGAAVSFAEKMRQERESVDLILTTDMLDLSSFLGLTRQQTAGVPVVLYFHENQLTYPWSPQDADPKQQRDRHYAWINYSSALAADAVCFNSAYHQAAFLDALPPFLQAFPDQQEKQLVESIRAKSQVLPLGLDLRRLDDFRPSQPKPNPVPLLLWNHRWEYDKDPTGFFQALFQLKERSIPFQLAVLGESFGKQPPIFAQAREQLQEEIVHWGYVGTEAEYAHWLWQADVLPVTARHDFFGASVVEAMYCGAVPLLPNRLAYPEHLPKERHSQLLYEETEELSHRLEGLLSAPQLPTASWQESLLRYDWRNVAARYDRLLESLGK
jgi:glycosyltransferase involved in cell wall biosynthesis